jgi:hypothetical protein
MAEGSTKVRARQGPWRPYGVSRWVPSDLPWSMRFWSIWTSFPISGAGASAELNGRSGPRTQ